MREPLDNSSGIGLVVAGMSPQGFTVSLGEHGVGRWIAVFYHGRGGHEPRAARNSHLAARCSPSSTSKRVGDGVG
jgi:hypothetical protein